MSTRTRVLTGITTSGTPHLGNYVGAIRPAVAASRAPDTDSFFFLADYHALIKCDDPERIRRSRLEIAASWLAAGLDPDAVTFYRQSDVPEIPELAWLLCCVTAKGLMNRAHAYKAAVDANLERGEDADAGVSMGLYSYPVLMAADILMFNADRVPVGRDQVQHIEMARDIAQRFNHHFGGGQAYFSLPEAVVDEAVATLPGLDGRKMSKSYDNTIPLFDGGAKGLREAVARIVTDSREPGAPKDPSSNALLALFEAFADPRDSAAFAQDLREGLAWGEAKGRLCGRIEAELAPMRARYEELVSRPDEIEDFLQAGATRARAIARPLLARLRDAVGLGPARVGADTRGRGARDGARVAPPVFKQYRAADGRFHFKLLGGDGRLLLHSAGFDAPRDAGRRIAAIRAGGFQGPDEAVALGEGVEVADVAAALRALAGQESGTNSAGT